jgi:hypothetical protein
MRKPLLRQLTERHLAQAVNAVSDNAVQLISVADALFTAVNRAQGAAQAGDKAARIRQLRAAARYAGAAAKLIAAGPRLRGRLAQALRAEHRPWSFSRDDLTRGQQQIAQHGLPSPLVSALRGMGVNDAGIQQVTQQVVQQPVTSGVNVPRMLANRALNKPVQTVAGGFRALARSLRRQARNPR